MTKAPINDCFIHDQKQLKHEDAIAILKANLGLHPRLTKSSQKVPLDQALGRVLSQDIKAPRPIPGHNNAAVDGVAFAHDDFKKLKTNPIDIIGTASAGHPFTKSIPKGKAIRIFTGAIVPDNLDTIAMQEDCIFEGQSVTLPSSLKQGANIRPQGEDVKAHGIIAPKQTKLTPAYLAAIASSGFDQVSVFPQLKVALFSTGDEIIPPGENFYDGAVYDANGPMLDALLQKLGLQVTNFGILPDQRDTVKTALLEAAKTHDFILSSGGASGGDEDHARAVIEDNGTHHIWKLSIKPGRPLNFGLIGETFYGALPGNPIASYVCFHLYIRSVLSVLSGAGWISPRAFQVPINFDLKGKKTGRREFWRAKMIETDDGPLLEKYHSDGSGLISSLTFADGLIEVGEDVTEVKKGDLMRFLPFD